MPFGERRHTAEGELFDRTKVAVWILALALVVGLLAWIFGGFLGLGKKYHPLPWNALTYDTSKGGYVVDVDKERLSAAPGYDESESPDWINPAYGRRIDEHYGRGSSSPV